MTIWHDSVQSHTILAVTFYLEGDIADGRNSQESTLTFLWQMCACSLYCVSYSDRYELRHMNVWYISFVCDLSFAVPYFIVLCHRLTSHLTYYWPCSHLKFSLFLVIGTAFALNMLFKIPVWAGVLLTGLSTLVLLALQQYGVREWII